MFPLLGHTKSLSTTEKKKKLGEVKSVSPHLSTKRRLQHSGGAWEFDHPTWRPGQRAAIFSSRVSCQAPGSVLTCALTLNSNQWAGEQQLFAPITALHRCMFDSLWPNEMNPLQAESIQEFCLLVLVQISVFPSGDDLVYIYVCTICICVHVSV